MAQRYAAVAANIALGVVTSDVGKIVNSLTTLALSAKHCRRKCLGLSDKVQLVYASYCRIEEQRETNPSLFDESKYGTSVNSFVLVVMDAIDLVKRYENATIFVKIFLALKLEDDFDELDKRLEVCQRCFGFNLMVNQAICAYDMGSDLQALRKQMFDNFEHIKGLVRRSQADDLIEDSFVSGVSFGESLFGGYIIQGRLNDSKDIILIASQQERREAAIMKRLSECENVLQFFGRHTRNTTLYAVMERPGTDIITLDDLISEGKLQTNDWRLKRRIALEIALGMGYAHLAGVVHRNLRSPNIFLTDDYHPKIFGFLQGRIKTEPSEKKFNSTEQVRWAAPEMLKKDRPEYNEKCDVFSLGVILWELITNEHPFKDIPKSTKVIAERMKGGRRLGFAEYKSGRQWRGGGVQEFIGVSEECMESDPHQRPAMAAVIERLTRLVPEEMTASMEE